MDGSAFTLLSSPSALVRCTRRKSRFGFWRGQLWISSWDGRGSYNIVLNEYRVMPFGLVNAPAVFQNFMNEVFQDLLGRVVLVYLDDILIYSRTLADHIHHITQVLRLCKHHLYLKLEKCLFHHSTTQYLGYITHNYLGTSVPRIHHPQLSHHWGNWPQHSQRDATLPWIRKLLLTVHCGFQFHCFTTHRHDWHTVQVPVLEP